tara:strand:- start:196 stop:879 length:684 start_codon:yes stop_codon:yes gene_type:complete
MDYIKAVNDRAVAAVNDIKYEGEPSKEQFAVMNRKTKVTIDWHNVLPQPPANNSDVTKKELQILEQMTSSLTQRDIDLVMLVDEEPANVFLPILSDLGLSFPKEMYEKCKYQLDPIVLKLKFSYERPRPFQLAGVHNRVIKVVNTATHQTPAYPSGHVAQAGICAALLSALYPEHANKFYGAVESVGVARMLQGVHYTSDNDAGMLIGSVIWEDIKYKIVPDLPIRE